MDRCCKVCGTTKPLDMFVKNGEFRKRTCKACDSRRVCDQQRANPERTRQRVRDWESRNPERAAAIHSKANKAYQERYPTARAEAVRRHTNKPGVRDAKNAAKREWSKLNLHKVSAQAAKRRAATKSATPPWANEFYIEEAYHLAQVRTRVTGFPWVVDHIVPLRGRGVCGLHVESNLAVIPHSINAIKSNKFHEGMLL